MSGVGRRVVEGIEERGKGEDNVKVMKNSNVGG